MTTRQISETIKAIYGFEASEEAISDVTDKILPKIEEWQNRPLASIYPIVFIDTIHFSVRQDNMVSKLAAYIVLRINEDGRKEVLAIKIGKIFRLLSIGQNRPLPKQEKASLFITMLSLNGFYLFSMPWMSLSCNNRLFSCSLSSGRAPLHS